MGIFLDGQMGIDFTSLRIADFCIGEKRNMNYITDTRTFDDQMCGMLGYQLAIQVINHGGNYFFFDCASTTAMVTILTISLTELPN